MSNITVINTISSIVYAPSYLAQRDKMDDSEVEKLEQAIEVHGYRGASKKRHNGVVNIKPTDSQLWKALGKYKLLDINVEFMQNLKKLANESELVFMIDVKIVAHCPSGNRGIGSIYKTPKNQLILYLYGFANYNHTLF